MAQEGFVSTRLRPRFASTFTAMQQKKAVDGDPWGRTVLMHEWKRSFRRTGEVVYDVGDENILRQAILVGLGLKLRQSDTERPVLD